MSDEKLRMYPNPGSLPPNSPPDYNVATAPPSGGMYVPVASHGMAAPGPQQVFVMPEAPRVLLGPNPANARCPSCQQTRQTKIKYKSNNKTHLIATILCVTTCCCCIPYCIDSCKSTDHHCSNCDAYLGSYKN